MTTGEAVASVGYLYSRPIVVTIPAHVRGAVVAHTAGYAYDYFSESSASSSTSYQQNGGAGGTKKSSKNIPPTYFVDIRGERRADCPRGYELRKVRGKLMCVPRSS